MTRQKLRPENTRWRKTWVLRETSTTRLVFLADLIDDNVKDSEANVRGTFAYQRKTSKTDWQAPSTINLSTLKGGEGVQLKLKAGELRRLYKNLQSRYGDQDAVDLGQTLSSLSEATGFQISEALSGMDTEAKAGVVKMIGWLAKADKSAELATKLSLLGSDCIESLRAATQLSSLLKLREEWDANRENNSEEYWQKLLVANPFLLQQVFDFPVTLLAEKAYVGGKTIYDSKGKLADFLMKNPITRNLSIIELKTPGCSLLGRQYRGGVFPPSHELMGGVLQALTYRESLQKEIHSLSHGSGEKLQVFNPSCVVIAGDAVSELDSDEKIRSFDLARTQLQNVRVLTFDELYTMLTSLIKLLSQDE